MANFEDREAKVLDFMDQVNKAKQIEKEDDAFQNSVDYKLKCADREEKNAKGTCMNMLFGKIYKDALPLSDEYKVANAETLNGEFQDFVNGRCPQGIEYYIHEGIKKGSPAAKKILEAVNTFIREEYKEKEMNVEDYTADDMVFKSDADNQKKIDILADNIGTEDITQVIHDNVKNSIISEINRSKEQKQAIKDLETELVNDMSVTNESAIENVLAMKGLTDEKTFQPSLFEGIMIGNTNKYQKIEESGMSEDEYLHGALEEYGMTETAVAESADVLHASPMEKAFVESVKEYTKLNILKAFRLENFGMQRTTDLANEYASME